MTRTHDIEEGKGDDFEGVSFCVAGQELVCLRERESGRHGFKYQLSHLFAWVCYFIFMPQMYNGNKEFCF